MSGIFGPPPYVVADEFPVARTWEEVCQHWVEAQERDAAEARERGHEYLAQGFDNLTRGMKGSLQRRRRARQHDDDRATRPTYASRARRGRGRISMNDHPQHREPPQRDDPWQLNLDLEPPF